MALVHEQALIQIRLDALAEQSISGILTTAEFNEDMQEFASNVVFTVNLDNKMFIYAKNAVECVLQLDAALGDVRGLNPETKAEKEAEVLAELVALEE